MKCPKDIDWMTLDTIAECHQVSKELYAKLWRITAECEQAGTAQPLGGDGSNGTTEIPIVGGGYANELGPAWHRFTKEEQQELIKAIDSYE